MTSNNLPREFYIGPKVSRGLNNSTKMYNVIGILVPISKQKYFHGVDVEQLTEIACSRRKPRPDPQIGRNTPLHYIVIKRTVKFVDGVEERAGNLCIIVSVNTLIQY